MRVNLVSLGLVPGIGVAGYLVSGWGGVLAAESLWAAAVLAGTLIHWLPHPDGRLRAVPSGPIFRHDNRRQTAWETRTGAAAGDRLCVGRQFQRRPS